MALNLSAITKPVNPQVVDQATGRMREEWQLYFDALTTQLNASVDVLSTDPAPANAEYLTNASNGTLSAERVLGNSTSITKNVTAPGAITLERAALTGDVTAAANGNATTIAADAVTFAKMQNITTDRLLGRDTAASGDVEEISVGGGLEFTGGPGIQRSALTGDVTASAGSNATTIANDAVTYAKMQNVSATARLLGRKAGGAGDVEECTLSEALDFGSAAQGDILYRGASAWAKLPAGTSGQFLQTAGAAANPLYAYAGATLLAQGSVSAVATLDLALTAFSAYRTIKVIADLLPASDAVALHARFSTDGGASYDATGYSYASHWASDANVTGIDFNGSTLQMLCAGNIGNASTEGVHGEFTLINRASAARHSRLLWHCATRSGSATSETVTSSGCGSREAAQDTDALRFLFSTGNIAAGNYSVYGLI